MKMIKKISIISPVFNEETCIQIYWDSLVPIIQKLNQSYATTWVAIDNGSSDGTRSILNKIHKEYPNIVKIIKITRNSGPENAVFSAIKLLDADIYCVSDADGEDPPSVLPEFISAIESGYQIAVGLRKKRYENLFLSYFRKFLYRLGRAVADGPFNVDVGDFSAFTLNVRNYIIQQKNSHPLIRLSLAQTGFKSKKIEHDRMPRISGSSKFPPLKLFNFSMKHGLSVTTLPLRMAFYSLPFFAANFFIISYLSVTSNLRIDYLILNVFLILLWVTVILSFIAIYVARIYKNGLEMPNSFIDFEDSIL